MTIQTKQVEVFVVGDKEFSTLEEALAYEKFLNTNFSSQEELEKSVEEKLAEENFDQHKKLTITELGKKAMKFEKEFFSKYTFKGASIYSRVQEFVVNKYILTSIREHFTEFEHLSDETVLKLYKNAFLDGHSGGYYEVENKLADIAEIARIIKND